MNALVMLVTFAGVGVYFWTAVRVGRGRHRYGIAAPTMTGSPEFERLVRVQMNTLEWLPLFGLGLWSFALTVEPRIAAVLGLVWAAGRIVYALTYARDASTRRLGFLIQALAAGALMVGGLIGTVLRFFSGG